MTLEKDFAKAEKEKKDLYLQACLEHIQNFTPMVHSADGIPGAEALAAQKILTTLLSGIYFTKYNESSMEGADRK